MSHNVPMPKLTSHPSARISSTPPSAMPPNVTRKAMLASMVALITPRVVHAENVRLRDVQSPALQAGIRAATEGRWADAERLFQVVLAEEPELASVWSNIGNVHLEQGRLEDALRDYTRAVELAPKVCGHLVSSHRSTTFIRSPEPLQAPVPYVNRALAHESLALKAQRDAPVFQRELQAALDDLSVAIQLDPSEFTAYFNRGTVSSACFFKTHTSATRKRLPAAERLGCCLQQLYSSSRPRSRHRRLPSASSNPVLPDWGHRKGAVHRAWCVEEKPKVPRGTLGDGVYALE